MRFFPFNPFKLHDYLLKDRTQFNRIGFLYLTLNRIKMLEKQFISSERAADLQKNEGKRRKRIGNTLS